jgi:hypothetical protein
VAAPVVTYASAIALEELAISATAGAHSPSSLPYRERSRFEMPKKFDYDCRVAEPRNNNVENFNGSERNCTFLGILGRHGEVFVVVVLALGK